jgi:hypothetical protein
MHSLEVLIALNRKDDKGEKQPLPKRKTYPKKRKESK